MSVMHVSWSRRWDQGEEEDGRTSGHVRRHVRKRGVHLSRLWGGRTGWASVRRQHRLTSVQIDKGETSRKQHQRNSRHVSAACFFLFPFFLLFCSSMRNGFTTPDTVLTSGIPFKGQVAAFYKLRNVVFIASHFCILRGASYRRSHYFWTVCFPPWKIAGTLPMCGLHFAM